ncbi:MAG: hypothetical protein KDD78_10840 [Caldilineaceae bacterium]|nr:hypothetical protein [Caldilineaceae bacterium]
MLAPNSHTVLLTSRLHRESLIAAADRHRLQRIYGRHGMRPLRRRVGALLIALGQKLQSPEAATSVRPVSLGSAR